jgi:hypothetical protein
LLFRGLAQDVGIEQPAHNLRRRARSRRRGVRSSMLAGHAFRISSQSPFLATRRKTSVSSRGSNSALKWSPGFAGASRCRHGQAALVVERENHGGIIPRKTFPSSAPAMSLVTSKAVLDEISISTGHRYSSHLFYQRLLAFISGFSNCRNWAHCSSRRNRAHSAYTSCGNCSGR